MTAVDPRDLRERLNFLRLSESDLALLSQLRPALERQAPNLVAAFYRHLLSFADLRDLLADPEVRARLVEKQRAYLLSLAGPTIDEAYVRQRLRIGEAHERVGLEPRWYLGSYALYFSLLVPIIRDTFGAGSERADQARAALTKLLNFDAQLAMDAYIDRRERELEYLNDELARAGRTLARDLAKERTELRRTTQRAREAEQLASLGLLAAGLAHEIGTPMGVIQGHARLLESEAAESNAKWRARTIAQQIERISKIVRALLDMARPRPPVRVAVDVASVIDAALSFVSERLRAERIALERDIQPVPKVYGDPDRLRHLFLNLLLNAIDAMPGGGRLQLGLEVAARARVRARVADTGPGIPNELLERIFEPFFTTKPAGHGSGLGLVAARGIALDHGGTIDVTSAVGTGSEFRVLLPSLPTFEPGPDDQPMAEA